MNISVILATFRRSEILSRTLESFCLLDTGGLSWEVIVVDNADDQPTHKLVSGYSNRLPIKYLVEVKNGKNNALNNAIEIANGDLFVFTDDDVIADSNWLQEMVHGAQRWSAYSVFGGRILPEFPEGKVPIKSTHHFFNGAYVVADRDIPEGEYDSFHVWGPNMAIRSKIFRQGYRFNTEIGPNGKNYIMGSETELTERLFKDGFGAVYLPNCLVHHQIRPEQLRVKWLYGRAFRYGRSRVQDLGVLDVTHVFNVPRYWLRKLLEALFRRFIYYFDWDKKVDAGIDYWMILGNIYQYRNNTLKAKS